eukprot:scaffold2399_cov103-Chaetoceros_neogracile.AAC.1
MDDALPRSHPLHVTFTISPCIAERIRMIDDSLDCGGDGFKSSVGMLGKSRDFGTVIHAIGRIGIEIVSVAG